MEKRDKRYEISSAKYKRRSHNNDIDSIRGSGLKRNEVADKYLNLYSIAKKKGIFRNDKQINNRYLRYELILKTLQDPKKFATEDKYIALRMIDPPSPRISFDIDDYVESKLGKLHKYPYLKTGWYHVVKDMPNVRYVYVKSKDALKFWLKNYPANII